MCPSFHITLQELKSERILKLCSSSEMKHSICIIMIIFQTFDVTSNFLNIATIQTLQHIIILIHIYLSKFFAC